MLDEPTTNWTVISFPRKGKEIKEKKSWVPARRQNFYLNFFFFSHLELVGDPEKKKSDRRKMMRGIVPEYLENPASIYQVTCTNYSVEGNFYQACQVGKLSV